MAYINEANIGTKAADYSGTAMLIYTDKFCCRIFDGNIDDVNHLLEIRIFNEKMEFKAIRPNIGKDFVWRELSDNNTYAGYYDEVQYLDIDDTKTKETEYSFTGGGTYEMPESGYERAVIRHYYKYDDDGLEEYVDERIVRFEPTKKGEIENA